MLQLTYMSEILEPNPPAEEQLSDREKKVIALEEAVEADRFHPIDFLGKRYYTQEFIDKTNRELSEKLALEHGEGDEESKLAEWEFTYVLGHEETLPGCRARLASDYDDHINGIDIVCRLKNPNNRRPHVFGIDICTATDPSKVAEKFARGDYPRHDIPAGCSFIKFFEDDGFVGCMKGVPRFVIGASPLFVGHQKYLDKFHLETDGTVSHAPDPYLRFNVLSSLYLQSSILKRKLETQGTGDELVRKHAIGTCDAVSLSSERALSKLIKFKHGEDFYKGFSRVLNVFRSNKVNGYTDECYDSIIRETMKRGRA